jgi:hypothetical protein
MPEGNDYIYLTLALSSKAGEGTAPQPGRTIILLMVHRAF